ncbi:MAG: polysaccharide biosynthesis tyrosine autokinase [Patulibacter sp.]
MPSETHQYSPGATRGISVRDEQLAAARLLRRVVEQWWLIALLAAVAMVTAFVASSSRPKEYEAISKVEIGTMDIASAYLSDQVRLADLDPDRMVASAVEAFDQDNVRVRAVQQLGGKVNEEFLEDNVSVVNKPDTSTLVVTGRATDPQIAKAITNAMVNGFIAQRKAVTSKKLVEGLVQVRQRYNGMTAQERASSAGQELRERLETIENLKYLVDGNATITQGASAPTAPVSPRPARDAAMGLLAGLLLGLGTALLRARLDDRIRDADELGELWDLPVVGVIPQHGTLKESGAVLPDPAAFEAIALARTNLRYLNVGGSVKTVVVTSALESEGKSTVTWNLGMAAAQAGGKVLVIEGDLRRPVISGRLGLAGTGFSEVLAGIATVGEAIQSVPIASQQGTEVGSVDVLPAGLTPPSPISLLESDVCRRTLAALRDAYDIVLIDAPPATVVADAVVMADEVDGFVVVSRLGTVRRGAYKRLREILLGARAPMLGQIVNSDAAARRYGYYGAYTRPE